MTMTGFCLFLAKTLTARIPVIYYYLFFYFPEFYILKQNQWKISKKDFISETSICIIHTTMFNPDLKFYIHNIPKQLNI